jgi:FAD/FMN-containing dehydrogenase
MRLDILQTVLSVQSTNITSLFGPHLSSRAQIIDPSTPGFPAQVQQRWTDINTPSYNLGAIKPATEHDVQAIVKIAGAHDMPFFVVGGGHGISNYSTFSGLAIDLGAFKSVSFSDDNSHLTIGGSVKIEQLLKPLHDAGRELALGSCACVGVVGATLGGGIGGLQGKHGLLLDALESVRIVTADGELVEASATKHQDLFWGLRGAGSNFGIVTSATYKLPEISNGGQYMNADFLFPATANGSFFDLLKATETSMSSKLAINAVLAFNRQIGAVSSGVPWLNPSFD